jgi:4-hydroxy-3-polyprenylbenzoate decarboxylase
MARPEKIGASESAVTYRGLRDWLKQVEQMGELLKLNGAHWDREMGATTQMLTESSKGKAPAILFDEVPGYPKGYRTLYGQFSSIKRVALTLGLPLEYERKVDVVKAYHHRMENMKLIKPKFVKTGPILENVVEGDEVDVLKFPVPLHHELDKSRYIGTADLVITKDPDSGWFNLGAYRSQVYDKKTVGCQITEGKHGRIHRDKYFERGQRMKVAIVCGQDPLLYMLSASPLPSGVSEYDFAGGIRGEDRLSDTRGCRNCFGRGGRAGAGETGRAVRRMDGILLGRCRAASVRGREDGSLPQQPDTDLCAAAQTRR